MCLQREAQADLTESRKLTAEADSGVLPVLDARKRRERATELDKRAADNLGLAREHLDIIIAKGDLLDLAHYHMCLVATLQKDTVIARRHGEEFLKRIAARSKILNTRVEKTYDADKEAAWRDSLRDLKVKEIEINGLLANLSYKDNDFNQTVAYLDRVLALDPSRTADWYNRARCQYKLQALAKAKSDVEQFLRLSPTFDDPTVKEAMDLRRTIDQELAKK
jgi:tetratricopeptide (TPR) repeat protein